MNIKRCISSSVRQIRLAQKEKLPNATQLSTIDLSNRSTKNDTNLLQLQQNFNSPGLQFSFGYGSGVFPQAGYVKGISNPQLDVIHVVENPVEFHRANAAKHPNHYSSLIRLGDSVVQWIQDCGAGVYFNPYVTMKDSNGEEVVLKYGVVSSKNALRDLRDWTSLYIAGRLQKPVKHLYEINDDLKIANEYNLESAFNLSLLIISSKSGSNVVTSTQLFEQIASISYMGDPRMIVGGENPNKVKNIVNKQLPYFEKLYIKAIEKAIKKNYLRKQGTSYDVTLNLSSAAEILVRLPKTFKRGFLNSYKKKHSKFLSQDKTMLSFLEHKEVDYDIDSPCISGHADNPYIHEVLRDPTSKRVLLSTISGIIAFPALAQSLKGILTAGLVKSTKYAWEKKLKSLGP